MKPLHDRVLVRGIEELNTTASGIIMPGASEKPSEGEVVAKGSGYRLMNGDIQPLEVNVGDKVLFEKFGASEVKVDGEDFLIMREEKIIGILQ
jgi:chaperonin GroES